VGGAARFPQSLPMDDARVYRAADSAQRFEVTFVDEFESAYR